MKKILYGMLMYIGFILIISESATFAPNMIGFAAFAAAAYKLNLLTFKCKQQ